MINITSIIISETSDFHISERKTPPPFAIRFVMLLDQSECFVLEWEASVVPYVEDTMSCPIFKYVVFFVNRAR